MAREGITPAGHAGFEVDISREEVETLLRGFLDALVEEQRRGNNSLPDLGFPSDAGPRLTPSEGQK